MQPSLKALVFACALMLPALALGEDVLEPGDELQIRVPPNLAWKNITVDSSGEIDLETYGKLKVAGLTASNAEKHFRKFLGRYVRNTGAARLKLYKGGRLVLVSGSVHRPGMKKIGKNQSAWQAISAAGGPIPGADLTRVILMRNGQESFLNVAAYLAGDRSKPLPDLQSGDTLFVPSGGGQNDPTAAGSAFLSGEAVKNKVFVLGAVARPGMYDRSKTLTAIGALALAGGPTEKADLANIRVVTKDRVRAVNLLGWLEGDSGRAPSIPHVGGAIVFVPQAVGEGTGGFGGHVTAVGALQRPGRIQIRGPTPIMDVIGMAGGPTSQGDIDDVQVVRRGRSYTIATAYDVEEFMEEGGVVGMVRIYPGDSVYVGENYALEIWKSIVGVISDLALISAAVTIFTGIGGN